MEKSRFTACTSLLKQSTILNTLQLVFAIKTIFLCVILVGSDHCYLFVPHDTEMRRFRNLCIQQIIMNQDTKFHLRLLHIFKVYVILISTFEFDSRVAFILTFLHFCLFNIKRLLNEAKYISNSVLLLKGPFCVEEKKKTFNALAVAQKKWSTISICLNISVILQLHLQRHHCYVGAGATPGAVSACTHHCC